MERIGQIKETANRIRLVNATAEHAELLFEIFTGANTRKYSPVAKTSVEELAVRLGQPASSFSEHALYYRFFGEYGAALFGTFVVKNIEWDKHEAEIGFSLLDRWQGQGLGAALVCKCASKLFTESSIERIRATVSITNKSCQRLMRSLGFDDCGLYKEPFFINGEPVHQTLYRMSREQAHALLL